MEAVTLFQLRDYQGECLNAIVDAHSRVDSALVSIPTGGGKTIIFARYAAENDSGRTMVICPQIELIDQAAQKLFKETGEMPAIEQGSNRSNESDYLRSNVVVASKQTLCRRRLNGPQRFKRFRDITRVIIDEAHYACTDEYAQLIEFFKSQGAKILGVTATPKRHDKRAMGQLFDVVAYQYSMRDAIDDGWLVSPRVRIKQLEHLDLSKVQTSQTFHGKDFNLKQLNEQLENPEVVFEICEAVAEETAGLKTAIYCSSVNEAQAVAEYLSDRYGFKSAWICADTKRCTVEKRSAVLSSFTHDPNGITHVANVGILTTGWDFPGLQAIVMARPTKSKPLHTQILGRGTRPLAGVVDFEGSTPDSRRQRIAESAKPDFLFVDLVDSTLKHKIVTAVDVLDGHWHLGAPQHCIVCQRAIATTNYNGWPSCRICVEAVEQRLRDLLLNKGEAVNIDEAIATAREQQRDEEDEKRRRERAALEARAKFTTFDGDAFGGRRAATTLAPQRTLCTEKQAKYLWRLGIRDIDTLRVSKKQAGRMIMQLRSGMSVSEVRRTNRLDSRKQ